MTRPNKPENPSKNRAAARRTSEPSVPATTSEDVVFVHGRSEDGSKLAVLRKKGDTLSAGILSTVSEGTPIHGELLRLSPRAESPQLCDVEVLHAPATSASAKADVAARPSGPARVSTTAYRDGWDAIWGQRPASRGDALPN